MNALSELAGMGVCVELDGERILVRDVARLTDAARALLRSRRDEVLSELSRAATGRTEALATAVAHFAFLPATTLVLAVPGITAVVVWTWSRTRHGRALAAGEVAFSPLEVEAMARAFETDRHVSGDLTAWCVRRLRDPSWRLTELVASNGVLPKREPWRPAWYAGHEALDVPPHEQGDGVSVGRLLAAYGARLVDVVLEDEQRSAA